MAQPNPSPLTAAEIEQEVMRLLANDPVCGGRVTVETVEALTRLTSARVGVPQITDAMIEAGLDGAEAYCGLHMPGSPKWREQPPENQLRMRSYIAAVLAGAFQSREAGDA